MKIRTKMTLLTLGIGAIGVAGSGAVSLWQSREGLFNRVENHLISVRQSKKHQLEAYFRIVRNHVMTLAEDLAVVEGSRELRQGYFALNQTAVTAKERAAIRHFYEAIHLPEVAKLMDLRSAGAYMPVHPAPYRLQLRYIVENPNGFEQRARMDRAGDGTSYDRAHSVFHPWYRRIVEVFGYQDLMIVDLNTLQIVYTVRKQVDLGTSLQDGPYSKTSLAEVVRRCREDPDLYSVHLADFESYEPGRGAPAAFICAAVVDHSGEPAGAILVIRLNSEEIDRVISGDKGWLRDGLGKSGDSGIVGADYLMRTTARSFVEDRPKYLAALRARHYPEKKIERMQEYNTTILQQEIRLPSVAKALAGEEGVMRQLGRSGAASLVAYGPLNIMGMHWTLASRMDEQEALAPVYAARRKLLWLLVGLLAGTLAVAFWLSRGMVGRIEALATAALRVMRGDLKARVPVTSDDELGGLTATFNYMAASIEKKTEEIEQKNRENEALLLNILPGPIAERLREGESVIADSFAEVTVLFADIVGFTTLSGGRPPEEVVDLLNDVFRRFDAIAQRLGVEKIKTIGDAYAAVSGLPAACPDHAARMLKMAIEMTDEMGRISDTRGSNLQLRIGINSGPVVAGVIGATKFIYDLWGDTVNIASRMESQGLPGAIQVTRPVYEALKDVYEFEYRGSIEVKGKGQMEAWLVRQPVHLAA